MSTVVEEKLQVYNIKRTTHLYIMIDDQFEKKIIEIETL